MSNAFCNYLVDKLVDYFDEAEHTSGARYCLRLLNTDLVEGLDKSFREKFVDNQSKSYGGQFVSKTGRYQTYTIRVKEPFKLIVACRVNNMTDDFLTTLRNEQPLPENHIMLMVTENPIDSISSGTADLTAKGNPLHIDNFVKCIRNDIKHKDTLSAQVKFLLNEELDLKLKEVFSEENSLVDYQDIVEVLMSSTIEEKHFNAFRMLRIDKLERQPAPVNAAAEKKLRDLLNDNRKIFKRIDSIYNYGEISELSNEYQDKFVAELIKSKERGEPWFIGREYTAVKGLKRKVNVPEFTNDLISITSNAVAFPLTENTNYFVKNKTESKIGQRTKNILMYKSAGATEVTLEINLPIDRDSIPKGKTFSASLAQGILKITFPLSMDAESKTPGFWTNTFKFKVKGIAHEIRLCVVDVPVGYFDSIRATFHLSSNSNRGRIVLNGTECSDILLKASETEETSSQTIKEVKIEKVCEASRTGITRLNLDDVEEDTDFDLNLDLGQVLIPFRIEYNIARAKIITGSQVLIEKNLLKKSFEFSGKKIFVDTIDYSVETKFKENLELEASFLAQNAFALKQDAENSDNYEAIPLVIPENVSEAYFKFIAALKSQKTLPSLAYYDDVLKIAAENYVSVVLNHFSALQEGQIIPQETADMLLLGSVAMEDGKILLSPLHPLNLEYQLELQEESGWTELKEHDELIDKLTCINLIPYIKSKDKPSEYYRPIEQKHSPEWRYYVSLNQNRYSSNRNFIPKLISEKIQQYRKHFTFLFDDIKNNNTIINIINMGDCSFALKGIVHFFNHLIRDKDVLITSYPVFTVNCYGNFKGENAFETLSDSERLADYIQGAGIPTEYKPLMFYILSTHIRFFNKGQVEDYDYSHLTFYEMPESELVLNDGLMSDITTGIALDGQVSGIPSVLNQGWYKTGFGTKYARNTNLIKLAKCYNSLYRVAFNGSSYSDKYALCTSVQQRKDDSLSKLYASSNWVTFISPQVDLSYFKKDAQKDLMIIHYSDQYTSSSGYDDITVTSKTAQYERIILAQLEKKGVTASPEQIKKIINYFNAINGNWLLRLVSTKKLSGAADSTFSREKMSILSAIRVCMARFKDADTVWIPLSLEELLRVSGGAGYSSIEGVLSALNLGFEKGPKSDDLLMVGLSFINNQLSVSLVPVEVKIGIIDNDVIQKAQEQVLRTQQDLYRALNPEKSNGIVNKLVCNFFMQHLIVSCEKMRLYDVFEQTDWSKITDEWRELLLNHEYHFTHTHEAKYGKAKIILFHKDLPEMPTESSEGVHIYDFSEAQGSEFMVDNEIDIESILTDLEHKSVALVTDKTEAITEPVGYEQLEHPKSQNPTSEEAEENIDVVDVQKLLEEVEQNVTAVPTTPEINVRFGSIVGTGEDVLWHPNNTDVLFHSNTGIIGTMGTGKTQFTKSLIAQLLREEHRLDRNGDFGILIFDYKGDYNANNQSFIDATKPLVLTPYHIPFNPLSLIETKAFKPLLPVHTASTFKCTLEKIFHLGPKQVQTLSDCIMKAYEQSGISKADRNTWSKVAPTLSTVYQIYMNDEEIKKNDSLYSALSKLVDEFEVFEPDPKKTKSLYDLLRGVVVIDLSGYSRDIQNLLVAIILDLLYSQMLAHGESEMTGAYRQLTKMVLVDEADNFMSQDFDSLKKILKEGRAFGVGTILSTQFLDHFITGEDDYSKYILTWVVHNVPDLKPADIDFIFKAGTKTVQASTLSEKIKTLQKHHSLVKIGGTSPVQIEDYPFWKYVQDCRESNDR